MKMLKLKLVTLALFPCLLVAQYSDKQIKDLISKGNEQDLCTESSVMLQEGYYYQAGQIIDALLEKKPESSNYNYRKGFVFLEMSKNYLSALPHLEKAVLDVDKVYDAFSANETSSPVDAYYYLGKCYHMAGETTRAKEFYQKFIDNSKSSSEYIFFAKLGISQLSIADREIGMPRKVSLVNLGSQVNTDRPEFSPVISLDGSALYFTSRRAWDNGQSNQYIDPTNNLHPEDVYVSFLDFDGTWMNPERLAFCDSAQNEATMAVSADERKIYLYRDDVGNGDIFFSDFEGNKFQKIEHFEAKNVNDKKGWETHCTVTSDGQTMYFTSDRKDSKALGGRDIYRVNKLPNGEWSEPINLGPNVNSKFDEESPFISVDNKTLYFSSNGDKSMGGFDIFVSVLDENGEFSSPINLGSPINSTVDDLFYTTTIDGYTGYLTSSRAGGFGEKDIYQVKNDYLGLKNMASLKGKINTINNDPLPENVSLTIRCLNCGDKVERKVFPRVRDGVFLTALEPCRQYELIFSQDGVKENFHKETFETDCDKEYSEVYREFDLSVPEMDVVPPKIVVVEPIDTIEEVVVKNFPNLEFKHNFAYNLNKLTVRKGPLNRFISDVEAQLAEGRELITIQITSSASKVPTKTYGTNENLTKMRAENMKYDLLEHFSKGKYKDKVNIVIVQTIVDGPEYEKDFKYDSKYYPFQFVALKTQ
jgi:tetratricopeptide (TPR) repeat protein